MLFTQILNQDLKQGTFSGAVKIKIGSLGLHVAYCCFDLTYHTQIQMTKMKSDSLS